VTRCLGDRHAIDGDDLRSGLAGDEEPLKDPSDHPIAWGMTLAYLPRCPRFLFGRLTVGEEGLERPSTMREITRDTVEAAGSRDLTAPWPPRAHPGDSIFAGHDESLLATLHATKPAMGT
jgi:hypothetical protein